MKNEIRISNFRLSAAETNGFLGQFDAYVRGLLIRDFGLQRKPGGTMAVLTPVALAHGGGKIVTIDDGALRAELRARAFKVYESMTGDDLPDDMAGVRRAIGAETAEAMERAKT